MKIPKNVEAGAALLDEVEPTWRESIFPELLAMQQGCDCILGQLYGGYEEGLTKLGLDDVEASRLGFFRRANQTWDNLTAAWRKVLAA